MKFKPGTRVVDVSDGHSGTVTREYINNEECVWVEWDVEHPEDPDDGPFELWISESHLVTEAEWISRQQK